MDCFPYLYKITAEVVPFFIGKGDDVVYASVSLEERRYALVEHNIYAGIGKCLP